MVGMIITMSQPRAGTHTHTSTLRIIHNWCDFCTLCSLTRTHAHTHTHSYTFDVMFRYYAVIFARCFIKGNIFCRSRQWRNIYRNSPVQCSHKKKRYNFWPKKCQTAKMMLIHKLLMKLEIKEEYKNGWQTTKWQTTSTNQVVRITMMLLRRYHYHHHQPIEQMRTWKCIIHWIFMEMNLDSVRNKR